MESCAYRWHVVEDRDHKKHIIKHSKNKARTDAQWQANIFSGEYEFKEQPTFAGRITTDSSHGAQFVEFDTNRIYLFDGSKKFRTLFTSGTLSDQMIFCAIDSLCLMNPAFHTSSPYDDSFMIENARRNYLYHLNKDINGWHGNAIGIYHIERFYGIHPNRTTRKFELWVSNMRWSGGDGYDVLYLEVTNKSGRKRNNLKKFLKGAHVTFLKRVSIMI